MTEAQRRIYAFVVAFMAENGYAPSIREICAGCGYSSPGTVHAHLQRMRRKGLVEGAGRSLRPSGDGAYLPV